MLSVTRSGISLPGQIRPNPPADFAVPNGMVGYWGFDADCLDFTNNFAFDLSGNGNIGTLVSAPTLAPGQVGDALQFNGSNTNVKLASQPIGATALTIAVWVNLPGSYGGNNARIFDNGTTLLSQGTAWSMIAGGGSTTLYAADTLAGGVWRHLCSTVTAAGIVNNYFNGALSGTANQSSGAPAAGTTTACIGNRNAGDRASSAALDDFRIYNRALDPWEVLTLYQAGLAGRRDAGDQLPMQRTPMVL